MKHSNLMRFSAPLLQNGRRGSCGWGGGGRTLLLFVSFVVNDIKMEVVGGGGGGRQSVIGNERSLEAHLPSVAAQLSLSDARKKHNRK